MSPEAWHTVQLTIMGLLPIVGFVVGWKLAERKKK